MQEHHHFDPDRLEREAHELVDFVHQGAARVQHPNVRRIIDLGSGPGVGTAVLAERFPDATVVAVDGSAAMLDRVPGSERIQAVLADLDGDLGHLGPADLVWASMSLHHLADPVAALRQVAGLLAPDGVLGVVEHAWSDAFSEVLRDAGFDVLSDEVLAVGTEAPERVERRLLIARLPPPCTTYRAEGGWRQAGKSC